MPVTIENGKVIFNDTGVPDTEVLRNGEWAIVRAERDSLIAKCDWTQLPDVALSTSARTAWASYRQALRDVTKQNDPANIKWPVAP